MVGTKRKIPMQKIEKKDSRAVAFSKRRKGLYSKASEFCLLSGSSIAILAAPASSNPNTSFYSFGHSSVDSVVSAFLSNETPREDTGLGFWWEDESLLESEDLDELRDALESMERLMNKVNDLKEKKNKDAAHQNQTLNFDSSASTSLCIEEDLPVKISEEEEGILAICDKKNNDYNLQLSGLNDDRILAISDKDNNNNALPGDFDVSQFIDFKTDSDSLSMNDVPMMTINQNLCSGYGSAEDGGSLVMYRDLNYDHFNFSNLAEDQIESLSDNSNNNETKVLSANLDGCNQEFDIDEIFDFENKNSESLLMNLEIDDAAMMNTSQDPFSDWDFEITAL